MMSERETYAFEHMRDIQVDLIEQIMDAFETHKYVMLEAPTGVGKSGILMSVALKMGEAYINTSSKLLQDQYLRDFDYIRTVKGKSNFTCHDPDNGVAQRTVLPCDQGRCNFDSNYICKIKPVRTDYRITNRGLKGREQIVYDPQVEDTYDNWMGFNTKTTNRKPITGPRCEYYEQKMKGLMSAYTILNYSYFLSLYHFTDDISTRELLVFDEAHNLEKEILGFVSERVSPQWYRTLYSELMPVDRREDLPLPIPPNDEKIEGWIEYLKATTAWMDVTEKSYEDVKLEKKEADLLAKLQTSNKKADYLAMIMEADPENWVIDLDKLTGPTVDRKCMIQPIETGPYISPVFDMGRKVLLASATLLDKEIYARMIGIAPEEIAFIQVRDSPFPKENRPIYLRTVGDMNAKSMPALLPKIGQVIEQIMNSHPDEKGIIHTTSYEQIRQIEQHLSPRNRMRLTKTITGTQQADIIKLHLSKPNSVLISPSMFEGVDLKDDQSRFQVIMKMPYSYLGDKRIAIKNQRDKRWYMYYTVLRLMQAYGRSIRNERDHAVTYILDGKIYSVLNDPLVCSWFREAIVRR